MNFDNTYKRLPEHFYSEEKPGQFSKPTLLGFNKELAKELGFDFEGKSDDQLAQIFSGQEILDGSEPISQAYAGHQFGNFVPQLGDGRALLLGEVVNTTGARFDIQLKGSGPTAFSRGGDGFSALGPVIREYILSEAMTSLGVPATRALAAVATGDDVQRETVMPGGVFTRVADSHIRIGTFQYFASRVDIDALKTLLDYTIKRHYPEIEDGSAILFFRAFIKRQISLVTQWMSIGFIHGVMNTDNMAISGETIDFGPCAFMDKFHNLKVFSSIDRNGRYAYSNQGPVLAWNMARLADCLIPLVDDDEDKAIEMLTEELAPISDQFTEKLNERMTAKLGLTSDDADLVDTFLSHLEKEELDFTLSFRALGDGSTFPEFEKEWKARLNERELDFDETVESIKKINPLYIPRNHQVERAIQGALVGDLTVFHEMNRVLKNPFEFQEDLESYSLEPKPEEVVCATFCGT